MIKTVAIVIEACFGIKVFCRETMAEEVGECARFGDESTESIVGVRYYNISDGINILCDVTVVVVARDIKFELRVGVRDCKI